MTMTTNITELRPRFSAFIDVENDLIIIDRLHNCETGFAFYTIQDAEHLAERICEKGTDYFDCDPIGTFYPHEDTRYTSDISPEVVELPARYTGIPVLVEGQAGFALRDHFAGLEAFFTRTNLSDVAALLESNQMSLNEKQVNAREQFFGNPSMLGVPLGTYQATGPEFLVTPTFEQVVA